MARLRVKFKMNKAKSFFTGKKVLNAVDRAMVKVGSRFGAFVQRTAKQSIKKGKPKETSPPGQPPRGHTGLLKRRIIFWVDVLRRSVLIGPDKVKTKGGVKLSALEHGGATTFKARRKRGRGRSRTRQHIMQARPFMGPALMVNLPKLSGMWRDSVKAK